MSHHHYRLHRLRFLITLIVDFFRVWGFFFYIYVQFVPIKPLFEDKDKIWEKEEVGEPYRNWPQARLKPRFTWALNQFVVRDMGTTPHPDNTIPPCPFHQRLCLLHYLCLCVDARFYLFRFYNNYSVTMVVVGFQQVSALRTSTPILISPLAIHCYLLARSLPSMSGAPFAMSAKSSVYLKTNCASKHLNNYLSCVFFSQSCCMCLLHG